MRKPRLTAHIPARSPHLLLIPQAASDENRLAAHPLCIVGTRKHATAAISTGMLKTSDHPAPRVVPTESLCPNL